MKPIISFLIISLFFVGCSNPPREIIACGGDQILIIDEQASNGTDVKIIWRWNSKRQRLYALGYDELLVSEHHGVHSFDITRETFAPFEPLKTAENIKSVNYIIDSKKLVYTQAEESWWTHNIYLINPEKKLTIPDIKRYKVRPTR